MDYRIEKIKSFNDERGRLVVFLGNSELGGNHKEFGQIYFVTFSDKGAVRGNHFHKGWREWFGIVAGEVQVELEDVNTKEHVSLTLSAEQDSYMRLEVGPNIAHSFKSLSPFAALLNYGDREWSAEDSYPYILIKNKKQETIDEK